MDNLAKEEVKEVCITYAELKFLVQQMEWRIAGLEVDRANARSSGALGVAVRCGCNVERLAVILAKLQRAIADNE